ncbi:MAG: sulfur carrier protein ThiS [Bacteroidales bacterium]|jgi:thiamine biosynthesis protein ThiS|nr:sulfur carrier protein ThiS [Bacteroidales bacterium]
MIITLNNRTESFECTSMTMAELMEIKKFTYKKIIVKVNHKIVEPHEYESTIIQENDNVVVLHLLAGG